MVNGGRFIDNLMERRGSRPFGAAAKEGFGGEPGSSPFGSSPSDPSSSSPFGSSSGPFGSASSAEPGGYGGPASQGQPEETPEDPSATPFEKPTPTKEENPWMAQQNNNPSASKPSTVPGLSAPPDEEEEDPLQKTQPVGTKTELPPTTNPADPTADPTKEPSAAPTWNPGKNAGQKVTIIGFDRDKLEDPKSGSDPGSKYSPAAKAFYNGLKQDVGLSRGGLDNMVNYLRANGFKDAKMVGDDKIDFGDGMGPIDVIRSDGQIVFQNTTGNPVWENKAKTGSFGPGAAKIPGTPGTPPDKPGATAESTTSMPGLPNPASPDYVASQYEELLSKYFGKKAKTPGMILKSGSGLPR
jgi:hypothetical protein